MVYSFCKFDYYFNTTIPPSILDGGSHILLANMLSQKRLVCSQDFHIALPVPSHEYVLVNRSLLCNCHLASDLTYLLKSLGSCSLNERFTMYFTLTSAFSHYMSVFNMSNSNISSQEFLPTEYVFDIFLNDTSRPRLSPNSTDPFLPLLAPDTLLKLFQSMSSRSTKLKNSHFFPVVRHTDDEIPRKGSLLTSTPTHILYLTTSCILLCILTPQIYLSIKYKKLSTLVTALALQRLPVTEAMSAFQIPNTKEAKLICQDPWVSIAVTTITILGVVVYLYKICSKMTFFKGYLHDNVYSVYLFISNDCYHVPLKLREVNGILHTFTLYEQPKPEDMQLLKHTLWDTMNIKWPGTTLHMKNKRIDLPENVNIPLWDKVKVRALVAHENVNYNIMIKQGNTWHAPRNEVRNLRSIQANQI